MGCKKKFKKVGGGRGFEKVRVETEGWKVGK
jgi:hypothetical protein